MTTLKLLVVEDHDEDIEIFKSAVLRFEEERPCAVKYEIRKSPEDALSILDDSYDGAIIDLSFRGSENDGTNVIQAIIDRNSRIPIAIHTATSDGAEYNQPNIHIFKKGDDDVLQEILTNFADLYETGLSRIMGNRGKIEEALNKVLFDCIYPQKSIWINYGKKHSDKTESALLRHTLTYLLQLLDNDSEEYFAEEFYLFPPVNKQINSGSIVEDTKSNQRFVVMNPACDLVLREDGKPKTNSILLAQIEDKKETLGSDPNKSKIKNHIEHKLPYYHWTPRTDFFRGGFINFRKLQTVDYDDLIVQCTSPEFQISPAFMKEVTARFSVYYGRQGQPDIQKDGRVDSIKILLQTEPDAP